MCVIFFVYQLYFNKAKKKHTQKKQREAQHHHFQNKLHFEPSLTKLSCTTLIVLVLWALKTIFFKKVKKDILSTFSVIRISKQSPKGTTFLIKSSLILFTLTRVILVSTLHNICLSSEITDDIRNP